MGGSIVVVNITDLRSDAIIVTADAIQTIPLPGISVHKAGDWINRDLTMPSSDCGHKNKAYSDLLRIWWIGTGIASSFPFHAAKDIPRERDISREMAKSTCYQVILSYTLTVKALQYAQRHAQAALLVHCSSQQAVIVTMPKMSGAADLPEYPDVASTVIQLPGCNIAHFACHGISDPLDPSESSLILQTTGMADEEPKQDILSVCEISQMHLPTAEITYLSACAMVQN
ncbi:hypothetical protein AJ80_09898 [Polytolypa hystricis UAMH7299]|uniref:CHAT domain-containing protein n=1 Tax=Polytolypa hystricis (strain UAMH7299) TaxID=1447883 RepID=A0A2B7WH67_POLH7|nr:hypothetical protein AJ80_09898 [Polytolypa hystricis UAMH7299]